MNRVRVAPSLERLRAEFEYDPAVGLFIRKKSAKNNSIPAGSVAGKPRKTDGHRVLNFESRSYFCTMLAWFWVTGEWPKELVTHINGDVSDNRFDNLQISSERRKRRASTPLTLERVRQVLDYNPDSGVLTWKVGMRKVKAGEQVTQKLCRSQKYKRVGLDGKTYPYHKLVWFHYYGKWPSKLLDHRNGVHADNRIKNLREASTHQNIFNSKISTKNSTGFKGVSRATSKRGVVKYRSAIQAYGKNVNLGLFQTAEEAHEAYKAAAAKLHGEFACYDR